MGKKRRRTKKTALAKRLAKMVTSETAELIDRLSEALRKERHMEGRVSDNDTIRTAVLEAIESRDLD